MAEYVDRQKAFKELTDWHWGLDNNLVLQALQLVETEDVAPVVHGQWSRHGFSEDCDLRDTCSVCGHSFYEHLKVSRIPRYHYYGCSWKYCPNCGAKMDLEN